MLQSPKILIGSKFVDGVLPLISAAKRRIDIIIYDLRLYPTQKNHPVTILIEALIQAKSRGVEVRVLMTNAFVRSQLERYGLYTRTIHSEKLMHAKMMLIDDRYLITGSHNYTQSAFTQNLEISVALDIGAENDVLSHYFRTLWGF
jgi:phosphatidylserine/phosphatidylglycerophosphate/cardiolipin synthase-like enzyme